MAAVNGGIIAHDHGAILQGPSTKTTLYGPDGSHISGHAPGGQVVHSVDVGYAAHTGHVVAHAEPAVVAHVAPVVHHAPALVAHVAHVAPVVHHVPVAHSSVSRVDHIHSTPIVAHAPVVVAVGDHGLGHHDLSGSGHEGQYVHDYTETLYDDGSYKPGHYDDHHHDDHDYHHY